MRFAAPKVLMTCLLLSSPVSAQHWLDYINLEYRFSISFPGEPIARGLSYSSANGTTALGRNFLVEADTGTYAVTVAEFSSDLPDVDAEFAHVAGPLRESREVRYEGRTDYDDIPVYELNMVLPNGRQNMVTILYHDRYLYIVESEVSAEEAPPLHFQQSITLLDADGNPLLL
jgi:hypothetical protein